MDRPIFEGQLLLLAVGVRREGDGLVGCVAAHVVIADGAAKPVSQKRVCFANTH